MTHRAVVEVIPSIADLYSELAGPFTDESWTATTSVSLTWRPGVSA